ncbi:hypothetical protein RCOM_0577390 [Ricinus communis]|uniref:Uncharacterized protein n=1 Tax=Ricinus communis TaxID=3988 RepID=B9SJX8_RICCO|nr:hypothetical protein RCOM_0577390 [Ricinus communis]
MLRVILQEPCKGQGQQNNEFILQQILYLEKLQLTEVDNCSPIIRGVEEMDVSSSIFKGSEKFEDSVDLSQHAQDPGKGDCLLQELKVDSLPSPFSQPENSPLPSTAANPLLGESFWQYRSPLQSDQLWSQNMQDLGVCEDNACHDDFNMPDVDITFRNFEELFGTEEDPIRALLDDKDASWSSVEKDMSVDTSHCRNARPREPQINKNIGPPNQVYNLQRNLDSPRTIRPSYSAMSFSISRFSAEGSGTKYVDSGLSPYITGTEVSYHSSDLEGAHSEAKENAMVRYKEKKKARTYGPRIGFVLYLPSQVLELMG